MQLAIEREREREHACIEIRDAAAATANGVMIEDLFGARHFSFMSCRRGHRCHSSERAGEENNSAVSNTIWYRQLCFTVGTKLKRENEGKLFKLSSVSIIYFETNTKLLDSSSDTNAVTEHRGGCLADAVSNIDRGVYSSTSSRQVGEKGAGGRPGALSKKSCSE
jgi:hypothetical protein